ncbi:AMP-binding protein [Paludisphaera borealis]|uniref:Acetyl-coenzyme A synthetase n=1 Tax=Paludisphaera borealis TaxID=1387353 RepID=A0A1U7CX58_9BACT|nr:AMP-binding protein [Paludisphaera borealis]APW63478.1 Acetyl-coenzyme A synthetase [Paludisphaera borealis]
MKSIDDAAAAWTPTEESIEATNLYALMREQGMKTFPEIHGWSVQDPIAFWDRTIRTLGVVFRKPYSRILDSAGGASRARWLEGAELNIAESCFQGAGDRAAIVTKRLDGRIETITVDALDGLSNRVANGLSALGLGKGDAVAVDSSMTAEAVALYLGALKMGGVVVSIPDSCPPAEIAKRLRIGEAKAVFTQFELARGGKRLPMYEKVLQAEPPTTIVLGDRESELRLRNGDLAWERFLSASERFESLSCSPHDAINILFSSGTTRDPKAVPWDHTTPIKSAADALYHHDVRPGDVVCWPTNLGWMMGPWLIFASLMNRATIALYEGSPIERGFCEFVQDAGVTMLGLVPSIVKGWRNASCAEGLDWSRVRAFSSSGEASNAHDYHWLMHLNQREGVTKPIVEYCGGTEVGGGYLSNNLVTPQQPSEFNGKTMGCDFVVLDDQGRPCPPAESGEVFLVAPALGLSTRLLNGDNEAIYFNDCPRWAGKTLRRHGDQIRVLGEHRYQSEGRADNTMNLGGIKASSAEIERVVSDLPGVSEAAAIGVPPATGGPDRLVIYAVAVDDADRLKAAFQKAIKERLNPLFHLHAVVRVEALPRTASNKVMHRTLRSQFQASEEESGRDGP